MSTVSERFKQRKKNLERLIKQGYISDPNKSLVDQYLNRPMGTFTSYISKKLKEADKVIGHNIKCLI